MGASASSARGAGFTNQKVDIIGNGGGKERRGGEGAGGRWAWGQGGATGDGIERWGIEGIRFGTSDRFSAGAEANYSALSHYARETLALRDMGSCQY